MARYITNKFVLIMLGLFVQIQTSPAQRYTLFPPEAKQAFPSVVYDFLETYLYEIDSLQKKGIYIEQKLHDDKVIFIHGSVKDACKITHSMALEVKTVEGKYYEVSWADSLGEVVLDIAIPMQYELLLGKPKNELEKHFNSELSQERKFEVPVRGPIEPGKSDDNCLMSVPSANYYVESLSTATYFSISEEGDTIPTFNDTDKWHSAANLFHGLIKQSTNYTLYVEQNLYGFKKMHYLISLNQWLAYCQTMKLNVYFAIEEEREDGMKALIIAQSPDLGFNHMLSVIIPEDFITNTKSVFKASLNAYIPTQNVKDLYQKYVEKPKKRL